MEFNPLKYSSTSYDTLGPAEQLIQVINNNLIDSSTPIIIVDLGCGPGHRSLLLSKHFPQATIFGLDIDSQMIKHANENCPHNRLHFFVQNLNLPFDEWDETLRKELLNHPVDVIFSNYALQWIENPKIICDAIRKIIKPKTGIFAASILYSDIMSVVDDQHDRMMLDKYLNYPDERSFISDWLFALKDFGKFHSLRCKYSQPCSIFPEKYYKESFINIPLKWHKKFIVETASDEIKSKMSEILKKLILKKRVKRIIPRKSTNGYNEDNNNDDQEVNDIEIENQLWILIARQN